MSTDDSHSQMGQSVGARIRAARQAKKYTQSQLASPDFSVSYISAIERGQIHPSLRALEILARRLDLPSTQLLPQDSFFQCQVYNHLGQHYTHLDDFTSSIDMFKQAIAIVEELVAPEHTQSIYWEMSQHYAKTAQNHLAILYSHKCLHLYRQQVNTSLRSEIYHHLGRAGMKAQPEKARAYLEEALQQENNVRDGLTHASITIRLAEWFIVNKQLEEAEHNARQAFELARPFGNTIIAVETLLTWGR